METASLILNALVIVFITFFSIDLKSYFTRKGQNLADKEDLEKLTNIVESVKAIYSKDSEILKSGLSLITQKQRSIFDEEKSAIVEFFTQWNMWVWNTLHFEVHEYYHGNFEELYSKIIKYREAYRATQVAHSKVQLLIRSSDLLIASHGMMSEALNYQLKIDPIITALKNNLSSQKILVDSVASKLNSQTKPVTDMNTQLDVYLHIKAEDLAKERTALLQTYHEKTSELAAALKKKSEFTEQAKLYLNSHEL
jgi:hypothetical protein